MASTYLHRTMGTPSSNQKFTISTWVKRTGLGANSVICGSDAVGSQATQIYFKDDDTLRMFDSNSSTDVITNRKFRDTNGWYHIVIAVDTSLGTASDRIKLYVNGVQETSFGTSNYSGQNNGWIMTSSGSKFDIGAAEATNGSKFGYMDGIMSHFHFVDNQQYNASVFGSTDSTTGEWKINASPTMTMGNMGFTVLKDGNTYTDQSTNSNDFSLSGTLTKTEDNPSNVFATLNPLDAYLGNSTLTYGNTKFNTETNSNVTYATSTLGMVSGKFYFEAKLETAADHNYIGIADVPSPSTSHYFGNTAYEYGYKSSSGEKKNNNTSTSYGNTYTTNDIVMCAVDLDNLKVYFGKNGTWQNSGDPTSGSTGTGAAYTITAPSSTTGGQYFFCVADGTTTNNSRWRPNFGNGRFGDTAIASAGTNASGLGIFEYDVPTGYTALCTKGLNE